MPRNPSGDYSLPAGNPVVSGTPISSATQNSTMTDVATALTDSLSRTGKGGMLVPFQLSDGTVVAPALTFTTEPTTGVYHPGVSQYAVAVESINGFTLNGANATFPTTAQFNFKLQQLISGTGYDVLNVKGDFTAAGSNAITGQWEFTYNAVSFKGPQIVGKGGMLFNDGATQTSGAVRIVTAAPAPGSGKPGDIWLVV
jgi:hypothetical protein